MLLPRLFGFVFCFIFVRAVDIRGQIQWTENTPSLAALGQSSATLDFGKYSASITNDGRFKIKSVPPGSYALTILTHDVYFDQYRVDVLPDETVEVRPYPPGTPFEPPAPVKVAHPITFTPRHVYDYYTPPPNFNIAGMLSSPMVLIMIAGGAMMLATPYLMNQIDMEEFQKENPKLAEAMNRRDIRGSLDAMMNEPVQNTQGSTSTPSATKAKGKGKKR